MKGGNDYRDLISMCALPRTSKISVISKEYSLPFITRNARDCNAMVTFMNVPWLKSGECRYEFMITLERSDYGDISRCL